MGDLFFFLFKLHVQWLAIDVDEDQSDSSNDTIVEMPGHEAKSQNDGENFAEAINKNAVEMR